jgi:hypothetical protein
VPSQRKSSSKAEARAAAQKTTQEEILRAASAGISITQDVSKEVGKLLTDAIQGLEKSLQKTLKSNDSPLSGFMQSITQHMVKELTDRANRSAGSKPGQTSASDPASRGSTVRKKPARKQTPPHSAARPKPRRSRPRRPKRPSSS